MGKKMINTDNQKKEENVNEENRPNDSSGIYIRGFLKITDPESGEVLIETGN
jgi:hypothetical protein